MGWVLSLRLSELDPRDRTRVDGHEDTLRGLAQQRRGSSGKTLGPPEGQEITAAGTFYFGMLAEGTTLPSQGPQVGQASCGLRLAVKKLAQLQLAIPERGTWATWVPGPVWVPEVEEVLSCCGLNPRSCSCPQTVRGHGSRPIPSWEPELLGSTDRPNIQGQSPLGRCKTRLRLWRLFTGLGCGGLSPHTPIVWAIPFHLPRPTEQLSPSKLLLSPLRSG